MENERQHHHFLYQVVLTNGIQKKLEYLQYLRKNQNKEDLKILFKLFQNKRTGYSSFVDMVNTEYEQENYQDVENIIGVLNKLGVKANLSSGKNWFGDKVFSQDFKLSF